MVDSGVATGLLGSASAGFVSQVDSEDDFQSKLTAIGKRKPGGCELTLGAYQSAYREPSNAVASDPLFTS